DPTPSRGRSQPISEISIANSSATTCDSITGSSRPRLPRCPIRHLGRRSPANSPTTPDNSECSHGDENPSASRDTQLWNCPDGSEPDIWTNTGQRRRYPTEMNLSLIRLECTPEFAACHGTGRTRGEPSHFGAEGDGSRLPDGGRRGRAPRQARVGTRPPSGR